jgi:hypothetical protein
MLFFVVFLIGLLIPVLFIKVKPSWIIWVPAFVLFIAAIVIYGKAEFFPEEGMADLAERLYFIIFGLTAIGSIVGALIVHFFRNK